jgi:hypothetical protein
MATQIAFDASEWMARFEAVGGHAFIAGNRFIVGVMLDGYTEAANEAAGRMFRDLQNSTERTAALKGLIVQSLPAHLRQDA